jgi:hypothetical protein
VTIEVKILGYHRAQRYAVRQTVMAAVRIMREENPNLLVEISELKDWMHIEQYSSVLSAPRLLVNEKLVCVGGFPLRDEMIN